MSDLLNPEPFSSLPGHPLAAMNASLDAYRRDFVDPGLWAPYVRAVLERQGLPCGEGEIRLNAKPGACPVFVVDERWVVKFFGRLFDGESAFQAERQANALVSLDPTIRAARLVSSGELFPAGPDWRWPYLVFAYLPGVSLGEVYDEAPFEEKIHIAGELAGISRAVHRLPLDASPGAVFQPSGEAYQSLLQAQRAGCRAAHQAWGSLPPRLIEQIDAYLTPALLDELVAGARLAPVLIHADLTVDHLLGRLVESPTGKHWITSGVIDFGDAMVADLYYELAALHLDCFRGDKRLLKAYLQAYGACSREFLETLPDRAMATTLLHRFNVLSLVFDAFPEAGQIESLSQLARFLWDIHGPA